MNKKLTRITTSMDIGEIEARLPTVSEINEQFVEVTKEYVRQKLAEILVLIAHKEQTLPREELMKYLDMVDFEDINSTVTLSKRARRKINAEEQCNALTSKKVRCTRKKKNGLYCGSHTNARPYGEVSEEPEPEPESTSKSKSESESEHESTSEPERVPTLSTDNGRTGGIQTRQTIRSVPQVQKNVPIVKLRITHPNGQDL